LDILIDRQIGICGGVLNMKKDRTIVSVIIMVLVGIIGFFVGAALDNSFGGALLFSMIAGIACIINTLDNRQ